MGSIRIPKPAESTDPVMVPAIKYLSPPPNVKVVEKGSVSLWPRANVPGVAQLPMSQDPFTLTVFTVSAKLPHADTKITAARMNGLFQRRIVSPSGHCL